MGLIKKDSNWTKNDAANKVEVISGSIIHHEAWVNASHNVNWDYEGPTRAMMSVENGAGLIISNI